MDVQLSFQVPAAREEFRNRMASEDHYETYLRYRYGGSVPFLSYDFDDGLEAVYDAHADPGAQRKINDIRCQRFNVAESRAARRALKEYGKAIRRGDLEQAREIFHALVVIVDEDHWKMMRIAEKLLGIDTEKVCEVFEYEELHGVFDAIEDGLSMIPWLERCSDFYLKDYTPIAAGYETTSWKFDAGQDSAFRVYREELQEEYRRAILEEAERKAAEAPTLP